MVKLISIIVLAVFVSACATTQPASNQGSKVELYGIIDGGIGVQQSNR